MNKAIVLEHQHQSPRQRQVRMKATALLGTRRFLALPTRVQNAIVPRAFVLLGAMNIGCAVTGSGLIREEKFEVDPYDSIHLGDGFSGTVIMGEKFGVTIRADDNLLNYVRIEQKEGRVSVNLDDISHRQSTLEAVFTMPRLTRLELNGRSRFDVRDIQLDDTLSLAAYGGSELSLHATGTETLSHLSLTSSGGSTCSVTAFAQETLVEVSGGGRNKLQGKSERMTLYLDEKSSLDAGRFPTPELSFRLSAGSQATVAVEEKASGRLFGASRLAISGNAQVEVEATESSRIERL